MENGAKVRNSRKSISCLCVTAAVLLAGSLSAQAAEPIPPSDQGSSMVTPVPGGLDEESYLALPLEEQLHLKLLEEKSSAPNDIPGLIPKSEAAFVTDTVAFSDSIFALGKKYPDVFARYSVDGATLSISIAISTDALPERLDDFKEQIRDLLRLPL